MSQTDVERKRELLRQLAEELGFRLQGIGGEKRGAAFRAQRFQVLAETAAKFAIAMKGATPTEYRRSADELVESYWNGDTGRTDKSDGGGTPSGYKDIVKCGRDATRIYSRLQGRLDHWQSVRDVALPHEVQADRAQRIATADKYLQIRDPKKHVGRPFRAFEIFQVPATSGGTNRDSTSWAVARMFLEYGDSVLADDVLDAILDNGGPLVGSAHPSADFLDIVRRFEAMIASDGTPRHERVLLEKALKELKGAPAS